MAALTRSGARKASEIVIFTLRTLHLSRLAMLSVVAVCIGDKFIEPTAPAGDRCDQGGAVFRTDRTGVLRRHSIRAQESHGAALILSFAKGHEGQRWIPPSGDRFPVLAASWMINCSG